MSKQRVTNYVFLPGVSSNSNAYPNAYSLIQANKDFIKAETVAYINNNIISDNASNLYPNAVTLVTNNRQFVIDEINAWIAAQVAAATSGTTWFGYTYSQSTWSNYTGLLVDAFIYDLRYGGNEKTIYFCKQLWPSGALQTTTPTQDALVFTQIGNIVANYIITKTSYSSQQSPVTSTQNVSGAAGEAGTSAVINGLTPLVTSVLSGGLSVLPATTYSLRNFAGYSFDSSKCNRDIGLVLDAYLNDLRYGGNARTRFIASRFWRGDIPQIGGDRKPEIAGEQFVVNLINNFILPQAPYTALQGAYPIIRNAAITSETGATARITTLSTALISTIQNGLGSLPTLANGVTTIKLQGMYELSQLLLITNTTSNAILYNFSDSTLGATISYDSTDNSGVGDPYSDEFPAFRNIADYVTTITLEADTSTASVADDIQIFIEAKEQRIRPYDFGTDAIERMRVASPQSMLDADFEYGLQPTKWQAIGLARGYPSVYEVPGTDTQVLSVVTDASSGTGGIGESLITVTTVGAHGWSVGTPFTIKSLANTISGFNRAEGTFIVISVPTSTSFTYYASAKVGTSAGQVLATSYTQLRKGAFYTGATIGAPIFSVFSNGLSGAFNSKFITASGTDQMAFTGLAPVAGAPVTVAGLSSGTQITSVVGNGGIAATTTVETSASIGATNLTLASTSGILEGMAIDNGSGTSIFVSGITGSTVNLTGPITVNYRGNTQTYLNVSGSNISPTSSGATFNVGITNAAYSSVTKVSGGLGYYVNQLITIPGTSLGGLSPTNDITVTVLTVNGSGAIQTFSYTGTSVSAVDYYNGIVDTSGAVFTVDIVSGAYTTPTITYASSGYLAGQTITLSGDSLGGTSPINNLVLTIDTVNASGGITAVSIASGTSVSGTSTYTNVREANRASFDVTVTANAYSSVLVPVTGLGYAVGQKLTVLGTSLGGATPANDLVITVTAANAFGRIDGVSFTGTPVIATDSYSAVSSVNSTPTGSACTLNITRSGGSYSGVVNSIGSGYRAQDKIKILGTSVGGATPANDVTVTITAVNPGGTVSTISVAGTSVTGSSIDFYSAVSFSEITSASIPDNTAVNVTAIAVIQVTFASNHGLVPGASLLVDITSSGTNHALAKGPFFVESTPTLTTLRYTARAIGAIDTTTALTGIVYARPQSFFIHRPYDGGVQLGTGGPQHGAAAIRMSKKYIRYQSGKGINYNTGALFAPSFNLQALYADGIAIGSYITIVTDDVDHGCQVGGRIKIDGVDTKGYNGSYIVSDVIDERTLKVQATTVLANTVAVLTTNAQMAILNWHGATVRAGTFDDQNGLYMQYDGQQFAVGRRSSTFQLSGTISIAKDTNLVTGTNTRFRDQVEAGDRITIKGMTHVVSSVVNNTTMYVTPDYRGATNAVSAKACLVQDFVVPQSQFNLDKLDGNGPSGYKLDVTKMQMIGMQWSWYAVGFIDFMLRGSDGNFIFFHRIRNSNVNTEAYMRTGNQPVRYEVINEGARDRLASSITASQTSITLLDATYFPNEAGIVYIDNELIAYTGKSGNTLTGCTRAAPMVNFVGGAQRTFRAGSASSHEVSTGVILVSNTISPIISHWGSAMLTDGLFDNDRGYLFNYASTGIQASTTKQTAFLIRLAPSVSNAIIGDLGERELLNRAQLLLKAIEITSDSGTGGLVVEGVLNPQNYPTDPSAVSWSGLASSGAGGQPSFAQVAPGGSISWSGGATTTTSTATTTSTLIGSTTGISNNAFNVSSGSNTVYVDKTTWDSLGATTGFSVTALDTKFPTGTTVTAVAANPSPVATTLGLITGQAVAAFQVNNGNNYQFFTQSSWQALGAGVNSLVYGSSDYPAGTYVTSVQGPFSSSGINYYTVYFSQNALITHSQGQSTTFYVTGAANAGATQLLITQSSWVGLPVGSNVIGNTVNDTGKFTAGTTITNVSSLYSFAGTNYYIITFSTSLLQSLSAGTQVTFSATQYYALTMSRPTSTPVGYATTTSSTIASASGSITGSISGTTLTTTVGSPSVGMVLSGAGITSGTYIVSGSGTTWQVNISQTFASGSITTTLTTLTAGGTITGYIGYNAIISGSGVTAGSYVLAQLTGTTGGAGTYALSVASTVGSPVAITATSSIQLTPAIISATTSFLYFTKASWETLVNTYGATIGTDVVDTLKFPASTKVASISSLQSFSGTQYYRVNFTQSAIAVIPGGSTVTFSFGQPAYALPGETIFSFIAAPGTTSSLDLSDLKELTNTTLGGRGAYPNGPDILAINIYKTSGTAIPTNVIIRWGEAQA